MSRPAINPSRLLNYLENILDSDPHIDEVGFIHPSQFAALNQELHPSSEAASQSTPETSKPNPVRDSTSDTFFWHNEHKLGISTSVLVPLYNAAKDAFVDAYKRYRMLSSSQVKKDETLDDNSLKSSSSFVDTVESEVMKHSRALVLLTCDFGTAWNSRKLIVSKKLVFSVLMDELRLSALVLSCSPKSERAWSHRRWVIKMMAGNFSNLQEILERESELVKTLAESSKMNYRAWNHRCWLVSYMSDSQVLLELQLSRDWAAVHVADNSCFHYRARLLLQMIENLRQNNEPAGLSGAEFHQVWKEELDWVGMLIRRYVGREALWLHRRFLSLVWLKHLASDDQSISCHSCCRSSEIFDVSTFVKVELMLFCSCTIIPDNEFGDYQAQATYSAAYIMWLAKQMPMSFGVELRKSPQYEMLKLLVSDIGKSCLWDSMTTSCTSMCLCGDRLENLSIGLRFLTGDSDLIQFLGGLLSEMNQPDIALEEESNDLPPPTAVGEAQESTRAAGQDGQNEHAQIGGKKRSSKFVLANFPTSLILAYQSFGVVYGDLSTSPLYVYRSIFVGKLQNHQNPETIFGAFSLIFWTLTLIPLLKYVIILLSADDNGEGGTFALYSLLCRHGKFSLLPNQQAADEELSAYKYGPRGQSSASVSLKRFLEKHKKLRTALLLVVLLGAGMVIGDGVVTPAMSVLSSVSGLEAAHKGLPQGGVRSLSCIILVGLFALQHCGTHKVGFLFAPVVILWLLSIFSIGLYNTMRWNPKILLALSPHYIIKFFGQTGRDGWMDFAWRSPSGHNSKNDKLLDLNFLTIFGSSGTEAMFADLGHFSACSIRIAFLFLVYPCLVVQYMGQAAFLSKNIQDIPNSFYGSIPDSVFWPVFVIATLASIVGSQAIISATFSIIKQCHALGCFPRVKVVHTSKQIHGQIYIPEINWILMILTLAVALGFKDTTAIGNAYGLAVMSVMFITTFLMALVMVIVWQRSIILAAGFLLFFWLVEASYLLAAFIKVPQGGWVSIVLSLIFMFVMYVWHYGTRRKYNFDLHNKVPLKWILGLGPSLGIVRVPGIGLIYSELATGVPAIFSHFVTNLPAFHKVLVFVCVKSVPVPYVSPEERFLIGRICPRPYRMYRCIVRYGYKDLQGDDGNFENQLIQSIAEFIQMEAVEPQFSSPDSVSYDGRMAVISSRSFQSGSSLIVSETEEFGVSDSIQSSKSLTLQSLRSAYDDENPQIRRRHVRFQIPQSPGMDPSVREELLDLIQAKEAGVAYIMGHSYIKARRSSSFLKKLVIDFGYSFLRKNCRGPAVALHIPHISLIEVGMIYHV
ncbi:Potassium transporter 4 [Sesamum alatum]|uniref:Potassium transporter n=1 Tax=Sesamum alatum TaxID=300844 RepID=A0AAE2CWH9_9LAMI|nr:Potassium transporter 4 [Sesamum alatum]